MKKLTLAALVVVMTTAAAPLAASAQTRSMTQQQTANPMDAYARDASSYGGQGPRMGRTMMRPRYGYRSRMMRRQRMMRQNRMMMRRGDMMRDPSSYGTPAGVPVRG